MKNKLLMAFIVLFVITAINVYAQADIEEIINRALDLTEEEKFKEAIDLLLPIQDKNDFGVFYILGVSYYYLDDGDRAYKYFDICDKMDDQHYFVVNYLIRTRYKQGNLGDVETYKQRLREIRKNSDSNELKNRRRFTIDRFYHKDLNIIVEESFDLSGALYYHWIFNIYDSKDKFLRSVNLESSIGLKGGYIVGIDVFEKNRRIHSTTNVGFNNLPGYNEMKAVVIKEIESGLDVAAQGVYPIR